VEIGVEMKLEIVGVENEGDLERERLVLKATAETDATWFAIFRCVTSDKETNIRGGNIPAVYWFTGRPLKTGDFLVLYSKVGTASEKKSEKAGEPSSYFYYWNSDKPLWVPGFTPTLVETPNWVVGKPIKQILAKTAP
jgi:hypothetical protein